MIRKLKLQSTLSETLLTPQKEKRLHFHSSKWELMLDLVQLKMQALDRLRLLRTTVDMHLA